MPALKKSSVILALSLIVSLAANAYLFKLVVAWQKAWTEQLLTTSTVERLYIESGADVSYETVADLVGSEFGKYSSVPVVASDNQWAGTDENAILVFGTKLFFKDGQYLGSKANLPKGLVHWRLDDEL